MILFYFLQPVAQLAQFADSSDNVGKGIKIQFDHGTTTLGFMYKNGIILAVDSRATGGNFIGEIYFLLFCAGLSFIC